MAPAEAPAPRILAADVELAVDDLDVESVQRLLVAFGVDRRRAADADDHVGRAGGVDLLKGANLEIAGRPLAGLLPEGGVAAAEQQHRQQDGGLMHHVLSRLYWRDNTPRQPRAQGFPVVAPAKAGATAGENAGALHPPGPQPSLG